MDVARSNQAVRNQDHDNLSTRVLAVFTSILLAGAFFILGFANCCAPWATTLLSSNFSNFSQSPYNHDDLIALAQETRAYTVDLHLDETMALDNLNSAIVTAAVQSSSEASPTAGRWSKPALKVVREYEKGMAPEKIVEDLAKVSDSYALDASAMSHLLDCNRLIQGAVLPCFLLYGVTIAAGAVLYRKSRRLFSSALIAGPLALIGTLTMLGIWAAVDFNGFFAAFHSLFFADGTWTFSYKSLLISMYPIEFWMGMGAVWLGTALLMSLVSLGAGLGIKRLLRKGVKTFRLR